MKDDTEFWRGLVAPALFLTVVGAAVLSLSLVQLGMKEKKATPTEPPANAEPTS